MSFDTWNKDEISLKSTSFYVWFEILANNLEIFLLISFHIPDENTITNLIRVISIIDVINF